MIRLNSIVLVLTMLISFALYRLLNNKESDHEVVQQKLFHDPSYLIKFGSSDVRYDMNKPPVIDTSTTWQARGWKGEKISHQILIWSHEPMERIQIKPFPFKTENHHIISADQIQSYKTDYVWTDTLSPKGDNCEMPKGLDSSRVEDIIGEKLSTVSITSNTCKTIWLSILIPTNAYPGDYEGTISCTHNGKLLARLTIHLKVTDRTLPPSGSFGFHLDLWQNPYAIARVHKVKPWSENHFTVMKPYFKMLAEAGQKVITASIIYDPWNSQTLDIYQSMIRWNKTKEGTWQFDYTIFDRWVDFMISLGIDQQINCYSMIPWNNRFYYHDMLLNRDTFLVTRPGDSAYAHHWSVMIKDFTRHLKSKNWFQKTMIAMDERTLQDMQAAIRVIKSVDPAWKISLAGGYHPEIESELNDYCIASNLNFPEDVLNKRKSKHQYSTFYTACPENKPNIFTFSPPSETAFMGWYAAAKQLDGYLRWAYNSWPSDPLKDSRFGSWPGGDTYFVYPGPYSSIRFEKINEGIAAYEKIRILRDVFNTSHDSTGLIKLQSILQNISIRNLEHRSAKEMIEDANRKLNEL